MYNRKIYLYLAILIPIAMIIIIAISVFFPRTHSYPRYNFLYGSVNRQDYYECLQQFKSKFFGTPLPKSSSSGPKTKLLTCHPPTLFVYDFTQKKSTKVTFDEAKKLNLIDPRGDLTLDGYRVSAYCSLGSPLGWWWNNSGYDSNVCIIQKGYQEKLNIELDADSYFVLLGWITGNKT